MNIHRAAKSVLAAATLALSADAALAQVDLLGDTLSFLRAYPTPTTQYLTSIPDTVVTAGPSDQVSWIYAGIQYATFDPEAQEIHLTIRSSDYLTGDLFDGYVISGFDHDIASYTLTNPTGLGAALSLLNPRTLAIDLQGQSGGTMTIGITLAQPVPEPGTWALMLGGVAALGAFARHRQSTR